MPLAGIHPPAPEDVLACEAYSAYVLGSLKCRIVAGGNPPTSPGRRSHRRSVLLELPARNVETCRSVDLAGRVHDDAVDRPQIRGEPR